MIEEGLYIDYHSNSDYVYNKEMRDIVDGLLEELRARNISGGKSIMKPEEEFLSEEDMEI